MGPSAGIGAAGGRRRGAERCGDRERDPLRPAAGRESRDGGWRNGSGSDNTRIHTHRVRLRHVHTHRVHTHHVHLHINPINTNHININHINTHHVHINTKLSAAKLWVGEERYFGASQLFAFRNLCQCSPGRGLRFLEDTGPLRTLLGAFLVGVYECWEMCFWIRKILSIWYEFCIYEYTMNAFCGSEKDNSARTGCGRLISCSC